MLAKITKFMRTSGAEKKIFIEAFMTLGIMRAAILTISFKRLTHSLKLQQNKEQIGLLNQEDTQIARSVAMGIRKAVRRTPWESACLVQSLTAQRMLQKRNIPGIFYLGVGKDETGKETMKAHAWSRCGEEIITGKNGHEKYTVLSVFAWGKK
jgi:hypothetical protein